MGMKQTVWLRGSVFLLALALMGMALATDIGGNVSTSISSVFCPIIKLIAGPLFWGVIGTLVMVGLVMMAAASKGFGKYFMYPVVAAILFAVLKGYISSQATSANAGGVISGCLNWSTQ